MWQKTSGEKKIDCKISTKGRRTKKRGGQRKEEDKEKRRTRNGGLGDGKDGAMEELRDGGLQKDEGPKTGWIQRNRRKMVKRQQGQSRRMIGMFVKSKSEYVKLVNRSMEDNEEKQTRGRREERDERTTKTFELSPLFRLSHCFVFSIHIL